MSGFLQRLSEKALGTSPALVPVITPLYGNVGMRGHAPPHAGRSVAGAANAADTAATFGEELAELDGASLGASLRTPRARDLAQGALNTPRSSSFPSGQTQAGDMREGRDDRASSPGRRGETDTQQALTPALSRQSAASNPQREGAPLTALGGREIENANENSPSTVRGSEPSQEHPRPAAARDTEHRVSAWIPPGEEHDRRQKPLEVPPRKAPPAMAEMENMLARLRALGASTQLAREQTGSASTAPVVRISIGRIEVRAAPAPVPPPQLASPSNAGRKDANGPTLAEYLAKRPRATL